MGDLKLVHTAEIVQMPETSTFDEAWKARSGEMKTRGDGREKTRKLWDKHANKVGHQRLLRALRAYLNRKEPGWGFCGLSVWLNGEQFDHWIQDTSPEFPDKPKQRFPSPQREKIEQVLGEAWCVSYLDPCTFHDDGYITPKTDYAKGKLMEKARELKAAGIAGLRKKD